MLPKGESAEVNCRVGLSIEPLEPRLLLSGVTELVSLAADGSQGNDTSNSPSISLDGRYVAFVSHGDNLVAGNTNGLRDIFVYDRQGDTVERVNVSSVGAEANHYSQWPAISADGRYVAFHSYASNLVGGDTNGAPDVFVHDRETGTTERVSVSTGGAQGNGGSLAPSISADGRYVTFYSGADNLVPDDTNEAYDIFVHDRQEGSTERVSVADDGSEADAHSEFPSISADGRHVVFRSDAGNLVAGDTNAARDVFVYDRDSESIERVSVAHDGSEAYGSSWGGSLSADGRYVAFVSDATNLVLNDTNNSIDVFVYDRNTGAVERVSLRSDGTEADNNSSAPSISDDGRHVLFASHATNLVAGDLNAEQDVFVYDRNTDVVERVSIASDATEANGRSAGASISPDGRYVAFESIADNPVPVDTNDYYDVFVRDRGAADLMWGLNANNGIFVREGICGAEPVGTGWLRVPGQLELVSVGEGCVWGINMNGGIFVREGITPSNPIGTDWVRAEGTLSRVTVGEMGVVWGLNDADGIFVREGVTEANPAGTEWSRVWGKLAYIEAGEGCVWGVNSNGGIFVREGISAANPAGTGWIQVAGTLSQISVGEMGLVWGLNDAGGVFVREGVTESNLAGTGWARVPGRLEQVSAGVAELWGINENGGIFSRIGVSGTTIKGTGWMRCYGTLTQVSVGTSEVLGASSTAASAETGDVEGAIFSPSRRETESSLAGSSGTLERLGVSDSTTESDPWLL